MIFRKKPEIKEIECLIDENGTPAYGIFNGPVRLINYKDYQLTSPLGKPLGQTRQNFAFKQFQFLGVVSPELILGAAIVNIKFLGAAFVYFYDPVKRQQVNFSFRQPLARHTRFSQTPEEGEVAFKRGSNLFLMRASRGERLLVIRLSHGVNVEAVCSENAPPVPPLRICTRVGAAGWTYVRKTAAVSVKGEVQCPLGQFELGKIRALGHNDWTAGYLRRRTYWNWACFAGYLPRGRQIGLNVSSGVNETGFTENCYWLNGKFHKLDTVHFEYDRTLPMKPWYISSYDKKIELEFRPEGKYSERINAVIVASNFQQLPGRFFGKIKHSRFRTYNIKGLLGFAEDHYAKW